ncbi:hypothetical protein ACIQXF_16645, partial [Lysinibacillus sp. NPDC097231]|uniref:hypothetical protein n=1 Tax=Lysinibacillus sp. NPDC097231 TaxID=3364142 RepID=UPI003814DE70
MRARTARVRGKITQVSSKTAQVGSKTAQVGSKTEVSIKSGHGKLRVAMIEITILKDVYRMTKKI